MTNANNELEIIKYVLINKLYSQINCYADNCILFKFPMAPLRDVSIKFSSTFPIKFPDKQTLLEHTILKKITVSNQTG